MANALITDIGRSACFSDLVRRASAVVLMATFLAGCSPTGFAVVSDFTNQASGRLSCTVNHLDGTPSFYRGPDARPAALTVEECQQVNLETQKREQLAQQDRKKQDDQFAAAIRAQEARGYQQVSMKDLVVDAKQYARSGAKVAVEGFYVVNGRNQRLFSSYSDYMMQRANAGQALNIGILTDDASRKLREILLTKCTNLGCTMNILGHAGQCELTNAFGVSTPEVCFIAEDLGVQRDNAAGFSPW